MKSKVVFMAAILFCGPLAYCMTSQAEAQSRWDTDVPVDLYMSGDGGGIRGYGGNNRTLHNPPLSSIEVAMAAIEDALDIFDAKGVPNYEEEFPDRLVVKVVASDYDLIPYRDGSYECLLWKVDIQYWHRAGPGGN